MLVHVVILRGRSNLRMGPQLTGGDMHRTVEAIVEADGTVRLLEPAPGDGPRRALVTFLDEMPEELLDTRVLANETSLADWERPEEDEAWSHFQSER